MVPFDIKTPLIMSAAQLTKVKTKPVVIEAERVTSLSLLPVMLPNAVKPPPNPIKMLKTGPAKQAVIAIFASPFFAMVAFAARSAIELPQARIVRPIIGEGMWQTTPRKFNRLTKRSAMASIQVAAMTKTYRAIGHEMSKFIFPSPPGAYLMMNRAAMAITEQRMRI